MVHFHSDEERDHFALIGRYIRLWAGIETNLAYTIATIYDLFGGSEIEPIQPMALKRRIKFLKKAFSRIPALVAETENMTAICVVLEREMIFRHDLVHGRKTNVTGPNDGPVSHLARPINPNEPLGEELADSITSAMLEKHYNELGHAGICSMGIGRFVLNIVRQQYLSN